MLLNHFMKFNFFPIMSFRRAHFDHHPQVCKTYNCTRKADPPNPDTTTWVPDPQPAPCPEIKENAFFWLFLIMLFCMVAVAGFVLRKHIRTWFSAWRNNSFSFRRLTETAPSGRRNNIFIQIFGIRQKSLSYIYKARFMLWQH